MDAGKGEQPSHAKLPGRRERKKRETRRRIFRAALDLFLEKGFEATTVEEIAERADVGKGTVFNYFPQKTSFLTAAYQDWVGRIETDLGPVESWEGPARIRLSRVFRYLTDLSVRHRNLARQVIFENMRQAHLRMTLAERSGGGDRPGGAGGADQAEDADTVRIMEDLTRQILGRGQLETEVRRDVDVEQAATLIAAMAFHTLVRGLVQGGSAAQIEANLTAKLDIIFTGLAP